MSPPHMRWGFPFRVLTDKTLSVSFNISIYNFYKNCNTFSKFFQYSCKNYFSVVKCS